MHRNGIGIYGTGADDLVMSEAQDLLENTASCLDAQHEPRTRPFCRRHRSSWSTRTLNQVVCGSELRRRLVASFNARINQPVPVQRPRQLHAPPHDGSDGMRHARGSRTTR